MYIRGLHREIAPTDVDEIGKRLLDSKAMHEREIALGQRAATALEPIRHYKKIDIRAIRRVREAVDDSRAHISYTRNPSYTPIRRPEYLHFSVSRGYQQHGVHAQISVCVDINAGVAELIAALQACESSRAQLARVTRQFEQMEEMLDAEEHIRYHEREKLEISLQIKCLKALYESAMMETPDANT